VMESMNEVEVAVDENEGEAPLLPDEELQDLLDMHDNFQPPS